jgi:hypothetical protein
MGTDIHRLPRSTIHAGYILKNPLTQFPFGLALDIIKKEVNYIYIYI